MFICGSRSFSHQEEEEDKNGSYNGTNSTPKRSKRSKSFSKGTDKTNKNPYANRGRDKFLALLADLDDKKQQIYNQMGSEEISFIRFVYSSDSEQVKPIIVKVKNKNNENFLKYPPNDSTITTTLAAATADASEKTVDEISENREMVKPQEQKEELTKRYQRWNGSFRRVNLRQPYYCFPVMVVLILLFLAIYGRSFAILCTSIAWYLVPRTVGGSSLSSSSKSKPKRKVSEKNML